MIFELEKNGDKTDEPAQSKKQTGVNQERTGPAQDQSNDTTKKARRGEETAILDTTNTPDFSVSDFARIVLILKGDEIARRAMFGLHQGLSRAQQDAGFKRQDYWGAIAGRFNDRQVRIMFSFEGSLGRYVDPAMPPLVYRSGGTLKSEFSRARSKLTVYYDNWNYSGNNDVDSFPNFLPKSKGNVLWPLSKKLWAIFLIARVGHSDKVSAFLDFS